MSIENRAEAVAKNIEGKIQEAVGEVTGNTNDKIEGQAKQDQSAAMHAVEDIKDQAKDIIDKAQLVYCSWFIVYCEKAMNHEQADR